MSVGDGGRRTERIGVLGGSFNPIHIGHIELAQAAMENEALGLDEILFVPAFQPYQKDNAHMLPFDERCEMIRKALTAYPTLKSELSTAARHPGPTYEINTLAVLQKERPDATFVWILGADAAANLPSWERWGDFLKKVEIVIFPRGRCTPTEVVEILEQKATEDGIESPENGWPITTMSVTLPNISSTDVRTAAGNLNDLKDVVPEPIRRQVAEAYALGSHAQRPSHKH